MSMFTVIADAAAAAPAAAPAAAAPVAAPAAQPGGGLMGMLPLFIIFGVMIFFMMRSQKKQAQKRQQMLDKVTRGSRVLLSSGMFGKVIEVRESSYLVEIADNVRIEVVKNGIGDVVDGAASETK